MADTLSVQDVYGTAPQVAAGGAVLAPSVIPLNQIYVDGKAPAAPAAPAAAPAPEQVGQTTGLGPLNGPVNALNAFTDQAQRALTRGLSDKVGALAPAVNAAVENGYDYLTGKPQTAPSFSDAYHQALAAERSAGDTYATNHPYASKIATGIGTVTDVPLMTEETAAVAAPTLAARVAQGATGGAVVGGMSGFGNSNDKSLSSDLADTAKGAAIGGAVGGALPVVGTVGRNLLLRNPGQETAELAQLARDHYGIPVNGAQVTNTPIVKLGYSQLGKVPFTGIGHEAEGQQAAFNRAVSRTFGEDSEKITPEVLQNARNRIGGVFNSVAARTNIPMTDDLLGRLQNVVDKARLSLSADSVAPVQNQAMNIVNTAANNGGNIGGKAYIDLTAKGGPLDAMMNSGDSGIRQAGIQLRNALDDVLQAHSAPEDLAALKTARAQWKAYQTVKPLTLRADTVGGATPSTGDISPAALRGAVNQSYDNAATAKNGTLPLNDLARIGQRFLKEPPDSTTATRELINHGVGSVGGLAALIGAHEAGIPMLHAGAMVAGAGLAGRAAAAAMRSNTLANAVINRGFGRLAETNPLARSLLPIIAATKGVPLSSLGNQQPSQ